MKTRLLLIVGMVLMASGCMSGHKGVKENAFVRLLVSDAKGEKVKVITPYDNDVTTLTLPTEGAVYLTTSGTQRFGIVVQPQQHRVYFVDSAVIHHGDHAHHSGKIRLATTVNTETSPAHLHVLGERFVIFNDGNSDKPKATYSLGREKALHGSRPLSVKKASQQHHGSAVLFDNSAIAVTEKSDQFEGALPDTLTLRDKSNVVLQRVKGIPGMHGNAGNGKIALFGARSGVVVMDEKGHHRTIPSPEHFNHEKGNWFGQILYGHGVDTFLAVARNHGVYRIDIKNNKFEPILASSKIKALAFDAAGINLIAIFEGQDSRNHLAIYDVVQGRKINETVLPRQSDEPIAVAATSQFIYVTNAKAKKIEQLDRRTLQLTRRFNVSPLKATKMVFIGADLNEGQD